MKMLSLLRQERIPDTALIIIFLIFGLAATTSATIINIPADYPAIQQGIDASSNRDTVLVAEGRYFERINFHGKGILLTSEFMLDGDTLHIQNTIIDADTSVLGIADTGSVVCFVNGEESTSVFQGFTCQNGIGTFVHSHYRKGGGIYTYYSKPYINHNVILANVADGGGGISCDDRIKIEDNIIIDNSAFGGGGILINAGSPRIHRNLIASNHSSGNGGGISSYTSNGEIEGNIISNNDAIQKGGAAYFEYSDLEFKNNIVRENSALWGGGILIELHSDSYIYNNIFFRNAAIDSGGGLATYISGSFIRNNIIFENIAETDPQINPGYLASDISYNDIQGGWPGTGNIDVNPLFRDPADGDFHLMSTACGDPYDSPCIDAGDPNILDSLLDCSWGLGGPRSDMGAYGGGDSAIVGIWDAPSALPERYLLLQNYPNPFNAQTTIRFILPKPGDVELAIYDLLGRQIEILADEYMQAGMHKTTFDASSLSSGVYFYRLRAGDEIETKRMVLLK